MLEGVEFKPTKSALFCKFLLSFLIVAWLAAVALLFFDFSDLPNTQEVFETEQDLRNSRSFRVAASYAVGGANKLLEENKGQPMDTIESIKYIYRQEKTGLNDTHRQGIAGLNEYHHTLSYKIEYTLNGKKGTIYVKVEMWGRQDLIISSTNVKVLTSTSPREYSNQLSQWLACTNTLQEMDELREKTFNDYAMAAIRGEIEWQ